MLATILASLALIAPAHAPVCHEVYLARGASIRVDTSAVIVNDDTRTMHVWACTPAAWHE